MAQSQLSKGCWTLESVADDRVALDYLVAAGNDLLDHNASRIISFHRSAEKRTEHKHSNLCVTLLKAIRTLGRHDRDRADHLQGREDRGGAATRLRSVSASTT